MFVTLGLRVLTLLFAAVVLGLSVTLYKGENVYDYDDGNRSFRNGGHPAQTNYTIFCGAWALLFGFVGIAAIFIEFLQGIIMGSLDLLSAVITVIGGIVYAVGLRGGSCGDDVYLQTNRLIRAAGTVTFDGNTYPAHSLSANLGSRCHEAQAVMVFLFFIFATFLATAVLGFLGKGRKSRGGSYV